MTVEYDVRLTEGYVLRHAPAQSSQGRDAAVIDIAQDLLLRHLHDVGVLTLVAFKGGTALRKVYAGAAGRFSTDLDFSVAALDDDPSSVIALLIGAIDGTTLGPFTYQVETRRDRYTIAFQSELGPNPAGPLRSQIDVGPPPWLPTTERAWVPVAVHDRYGGPLPTLPIVDLAENIAEKIARLNRRCLARDAYDLVWLASTPGFDVNRHLVRRLAILKAWVDLNGLRSEHATWASPLPAAGPFDAKKWLNIRAARDFDDESIGLLTVPPPHLADLGQALSRLYRWLADLTPQERAIAQGRPQDRPLALRLLGELPGARMSEIAW